MAVREKTSYFSIPAKSDRGKMTMISPNEFWLNLHQLAESYQAEGLTTQDRTDAIVNQFLNMPPLVRRQVLGELKVIADHLPDLHNAVVAAASEAEAPIRMRSATA